MQFLYLGDVTVPQHRLQAVLAAAQDLQIHQLRLIIRLFPICSNGRFLEALYKCLLFLSVEVKQVLVITEQRQVSLKQHYHPPNL